MWCNDDMVLSASLVHILAEDAEELLPDDYDEDIDQEYAVESEGNSTEDEDY